MPQSDGSLYLKCHLGNLGSVVWIRIPHRADPAAFARDVFMAARLDVPELRRRLKLSGTFVGGYSIVHWGYREWVSYGGHYNRGRWKLTDILGEVNERNAGRPPADIRFERGPSKPPRENPPPILTRQCSRHWDLTPRDPIRENNVYIHIAVPPGFVADKFFLSGVTTFHGVYADRHDGSDADVYELTTQSEHAYPIPSSSTTASGRQIFPTNPLLGNYSTPSPATSPETSVHRFLFDEPVLIFPYNTNPDGSDTGIPNALYKFDPNVRRGQELPQDGYYSHYEVTTTVPPNWFGFGNLSRAGSNGAHSGEYVKKYRATLDYTLSMHYTQVPAGYRPGWGGSVTFREKSCKPIPKPEPERSNVCVSGMDIEGNCLVVKTCNPDGSSSAYKLCVGFDGFTPELRFSEQSKAAHGQIDIAVSGDGARITFTDESGYSYPVLDTKDSLGAGR